jgi:hypothetical protein
VVLHLLINHVVRPRLDRAAEQQADNLPVESGASQVTA